MEKIDPYKSKERLDKWKQSPINGISKTNILLLKDYIFDMEKGINVSGTHKGARSPVKLLSLASRLKRIMELSESLFKKKDITKLTEDNIHDLFLAMSSGKITKANGKPYLDVGDYVKRFKSFWHWYMKKCKKDKVVVLDITDDLSVSKSRKPPFVYFRVEDVERMLKAADYDTKTIMMFLFDTGMRAPTEMMNVRVSDFINDYTELNIREETTKNNYGRRIRLMLCSSIVKKYIEDNNLRDNDLVFTIEPATLNKRLKKIGKEILGDKLTLGRRKGSELTMYDFRHSSGCYWIQRYKSEMSVMYRFAWKNRGMIDYYTELLGMKDLITEEDMIVGMDKTEIEKRMINQEREIEELKAAFKKESKITERALFLLEKLQKKYPKINLK